MSTTLLPLKMLIFLLNPKGDSGVRVGISGTSHHGESLEERNKARVEGAERGPHQDCDDYRYVGFRSPARSTLKRSVTWASPWDWGRGDLCCMALPPWQYMQAGAAFFFLRQWLDPILCTLPLILFRVLWVEIFVHRLEPWLSQLRACYASGAEFREPAAMWKKRTKRGDSGLNLCAGRWRQEENAGGLLGRSRSSWFSGRLR